MMKHFKQKLQLLLSGIFLAILFFATNCKINSVSASADPGRSCQIQGNLRSGLRA